MESPTNSDIAANLLVLKDRFTQGLKADFECLLKKFYGCGSSEFPAFSSIWRSMKMSMLTAGRVTDRETRQFTEEYLQIIVTYFHPQQNFETITGAFYIMYSLYMTQPLMPKSKIRLTIKNWSSINSFIGEAITKQLHDVEFIFHKLCAMKAFLYVAPPNEISFDIDPSEDDDVYIKQLFNQQTSALESIFTNDNVEQLSAIHNQYQEMKCILSGIETSTPDSSINMLDVNTATVIADLMQTFKNDPQYPGKKKRTEQSPEKADNGKISSQKEEVSKDSSDSLKNENKPEETAETSSASTCVQVDLSSEEEDDNCDSYYQVGDENDLIISENNDDDDDDIDEEMDDQ